MNQNAVIPAKAVRPVIPAKAGIQGFYLSDALDPRLRGDDGTHVDDGTRRDDGTRGMTVHMWMAEHAGMTND